MHEGLSTGHIRQCESSPRLAGLEAGESFLEVCRAEVNTTMLKITLNPYAYHLAKIDWAIWGVLTWKDGHFGAKTSAASQMRRDAYLGLLRVTCTRHKLKMARQVWYAKSEWDESTRGHLHFLVGRDGLRGVSPSSLAEEMEQTWQGYFKNGTSRIRPFDDSIMIKGVTYQMKCPIGYQPEPPKGEEFSSELWKAMKRNADATCSCQN